MQPALCVTVPGLYGSDDNHWQTWAERDIPNCKRVSGIDFDRPIVAAWAAAIRQEIKMATGSVILLAHSFGCLASVMALADHEVKVCALVLVAPASPERFDASGLLSSDKQPAEGVTLMSCMPQQPVNAPGIVIASSNDPWMPLPQAKGWADAWGLRFLNLHKAGHINSASGFGRWPAVHRVVSCLRDELSSVPLGCFEPLTLHSKNRFSALIKARRMTREAIQ